MWRRSSAKLLSSVRSVARPNHIVTSSLCPAILRPSATIVARHYSRTVYKRVRDFFIGTGWEDPLPEIVGGDIVDHEFLNGPFGTKESPLVMKSLYDVQVAGCDGPKGEAHDDEWFWLKHRETNVCPRCSQHFQLKCVGAGGYPPNYQINTYIIGSDVGLPKVSGGFGNKCKL